jgi:hypothetical protein
MRPFLFLLFVVLMACQAHAGRVRLGKITASGDGCPNANSLNFTISPDSRALSVLFDQLVVESGGATTRREETKTCSFTLQIELPAGENLAVAQVDYRGFVFGEKQNIFNHMSSDFYLDQKPVRHFERKFKGPINDVFTLSEVVPMRERHKSNCTGKLNLNVAIRLTTRTNPQGEATMLALDSLDAANRKGGIVYGLDFTPCH